ncbi:proenkephalin-A isoform X1 [Suncus etruscus]|uniref:proenkephalin-A isoform X1 n=1 Tax=Suncus etruscus TaxID=109475 RepID=UPI002110DB8D|nr:proenkephalin-A isoform X1 [Suncus etruscus]XP_049637881.1 proenkephalin-A isoform X1 [Suncus etruscus]
MARFLRFCTLVLALGPGLLATVRAGCVEDCNACAANDYPYLNLKRCYMECDLNPPYSKIWIICKKYMHRNKMELTRDDIRENSDEDEAHFLPKKYGGFMKRYGGFMKKLDTLYMSEPEDTKQEEILSKRYGGFMKKDAETEDDLKELVGAEAPRESNIHQYGRDRDEEVSKRYGGFMKKDAEEEDDLKELVGAEAPREVNIHQYGRDRDEEVSKRYGGFMKKDAEEEDDLKELVGTEAPREVNIHQYGRDRDEEESKRYGGFMQSSKRSPELEDEAKELQKRYGGFMRRVGSPSSDWWMLMHKRYRGLLKRFASTPPYDKEDEDSSKEGPEMEKRYGGFMKF